MRLVVCCDGTWNTPNNLDGGTPAPTNVYKFHTAVSENENQKKYYRSGVGTSGGFLRRLSGGALGYGIDDDIKSPYKWLCDHFDHDEPDEIALIGFSRGAYTVRSLAGLIGKFGLCKFKDSDYSEDQRWSYVSGLYKDYRQREDVTLEEVIRSDDVRIRFLGVFDTVGALGIPPDFNFTRRLFNRKKYQFHDTILGDKVDTARHALAMDERRLSFTPTLWTNTESDRDVEELWFPGVHGDVGGSYAENGLGDITLNWMIDAAMECGVDFQDRFRDQIDPNDRGILHDSVQGGFRYLRTQPRAVPNLLTDARVHKAARRRAAKPPISQSNYWPTTTITEDMEVVRSVSSKEQWVMTGIFLESEKTYRFTARGEWLDKQYKSGPAGFSTRWTAPAHLFSSGVGRLKRVLTFGDETRSSEAILARRQDQWPWFALIGVVANGILENPEESENGRDPLPPTHETFLIGDMVASFRPKKSGYLYCYANDAWHFYGNNRGKITLTVCLDASE